MGRTSTLELLSAVIIYGLLCWLSFRAYGKVCLQRDNATKQLLAGFLLVIGWVMLIDSIIFAGCGVSALMH